MNRWSIFMTAVGFLFVFEGISPFLSPQAWRKLMQKMLAQSDQVTRIFGLLSMLVGLGLIFLARDYYH